MHSLRWGARHDQTSLGSTDAGTVKPRVHVAVVGAGAAGLSCARALLRRGMRVTLVEARDCTGGRVHSVPAGSLPCELGAELVHGRPREVFELAREAGARVAEIVAPRLASLHGEILRGDGGQQPVESILARVSLRDDDEGLTGFLRRTFTDGDDARRALRYVESFHAADPTEASVHALLHTQRADAALQSQHQHFLPGGYGRLVDFLVQETQKLGGELLLGHAVNDVRWRPGVVELRCTTSTCGPTTVRADAAVVTLPVGVLQAGDVRFSPPLADKADAIAAFGVGQALRFTLTLSRPVWIDSPVAALHEPWSFLFTDDDHVPVFWRRGEARDTLVAWTAGSYAERMPEEPEARRAVIALSLAHHLKVPVGAVEAAIARVDVHDWGSDPYARGAYTWYRRGGEWASTALAAPLYGTLFFAGEATDLCFHNGTVHGAIASGLRAAQDLLRSRAPARAADAHRAG